MRCESCKPRCPSETASPRSAAWPVARTSQPNPKSLCASCGYIACTRTSAIRKAAWRSNSCSFWTRHVKARRHRRVRCRSSDRPIVRPTRTLRHRKRGNGGPSEAIQSALHHGLPPIRRGSDADRTIHHWRHRPTAFVRARCVEILGASGPVWRATGVRAWLLPPGTRARRPAHCWKPRNEPSKSPSRTPRRQLWIGCPLRWRHDDTGLLTQDCESRSIACVAGSLAHLGNAIFS